MSNTLEKQILRDGPRNAVVKVSGVLDTSDLASTPVFSLTDFTNNDRGMILVGFRVDYISYSVGPNVIAILSWDSNAPQQIAVLQGHDGQDYSHAGGLQPDQSRSGFNGSITLQTRGYVGGSVQAITLEICTVKLYVR